MLNAHYKIEGSLSGRVSYPINKDEDFYFYKETITDEDGRLKASIPGKNGNEAVLLTVSSSGR